MEKVETKPVNSARGGQTDRVQKILFGVMIVSIVAYITALILYICTKKAYMFSDFAETLSYCLSQNPYNGVDGIHSIYPPFAFLPFYLFALICKPALLQYIAGDITLTQLSQDPTFIISFLLFYAICITVVLLLSAKLSKFKGRKLIYLLVSIFCSAPFAYCMFRGNNIIFVCILVMLFFMLYNSDKRWKREIANLCLAAAVAFKIYPALLLVFFIKDRRFWDLLKTLLYAVLLIFLPFLLIEGGFKNIKEIWSNFTLFNGGQGRDMNWTNIGFDGLASKIATFLHLPVLHSLLSKFFRFGSIIVTILALCFAKNSKLKMQPILITLLTYELFQGVSYAYTLTMLVVPMIIYFVEFDSLSTLNKWFYGICFALIALPIYAGINFFFIAQLSAVCLLVKGYVDIFAEFHANTKLKKQAKTVEQNNDQPVAEKSE